MRYATDICAFLGVLLIAAGVWWLYGWGWSLIAAGSLVYLTTILTVCLTYVAQQNNGSDSG